MANPKSVQERFTSGRWQAGRLEFPGRGGDAADVWVVDVIVVEEEEDEDLRAIARYRPARGMTPDLGPVIERAIREPVDGRPHLPALVRVATEELAAEIHKARPEVKVVIGPTALVDELGRDLAEGILPSPDDGEEQWRWLDKGVSAEQMGRLFAAMTNASERLVSDALIPGQLFKVTAPSLKLTPAWIHVTAAPAITGGSVFAVAIAPDKKARAAWDSDDSTESEIAIYGVELDELTPEAYAELKQHAWPTRGLHPRVAAGGDEERLPTPVEVEVAIAALEALAGSFDPFASDVTPGAERKVTLSSGAAATIVAPPDEILDLDLDEEDDDDEDDAFINPGEEDESFLDADDARAWLAAPAPVQATIRNAPKPGRNDPCWCGSGLKYKKCHLDKDR